MLISRIEIETATVDSK